jgi:hypothetical protein
MSEARPDQPNIRLSSTAVKHLSKFEYGKFYLDQTNAPVVRVGEDDFDTTTEFTYVEFSDIGNGYVSGSEGRVKSIKEHMTITQSDSLAKLTTMFYENSSFPTKPTKITVAKVAI